jgi:hypothetical protein
MPWFVMGVNGSLRNSQEQNPGFMGFDLHPDVDQRGRHRAFSPPMRRTIFFGQQA